MIYALLAMVIIEIKVIFVNVIQDTKNKITLFMIQDLGIAFIVPKSVHNVNMGLVALNVLNSKMN